MKKLGKRPPNDRPIYIHQDRPIKPIPFVQIVAVMALIFLALVMADKCNIIQLANTQGL